jgi:small-conductance mechanosensitive channel
VRVETLGESGITLKVLGSVRAGDQWAARGEFRKRLLVALAANDIEIPYPHRVIVNRVEGPAATAAAAADATAADAGAAAGTDDPDT